MEFLKDRCFKFLSSRAGCTSCSMSTNVCLFFSFLFLVLSMLFWLLLLYMKNSAFKEHWSSDVHCGRRRVYTVKVGWFCTVYWVGIVNIKTLAQIETNKQKENVFYPVGVKRCFTCWDFLNVAHKYRMQTLKAVFTWCVCPLFTVVMTMQDLSMLEWACFNVYIKPIRFGGKNEILRASVMAGYKKIAWKLVRIIGNGIVTRDNWLKSLFKNNPRAMALCICSVHWNGCYLQDV